MANTRYTLTPQAADFPTSNPAQRLIVNQRSVLAFDAATKEGVFWVFVVPQGLASGYQVDVHYTMASATTGDIDIDISIESVTPGDAFDLDAGDSYDTANPQDENSVPGTAGYEQKVSVTISNDDGIAAGDLCRLKLERDAPNDSASGDLYVHAVEFRDGV